MSIYTLALDDGSQVEVEAPRDTPLQELLMLAQQQRRDVGKEERLAARRARQIRLEEAAGDPVIIPKDARTALGRGIGRGIDSLQQNLGSAIEGVGGLLGLEGVEEYGANVALENEAALQRSERFSTRLDDIEGVGTGASYVGELAGESAPQMGAVAAGAAAGAAAGSAFFGVGAIPGALVGAAVGGFAAGFPLFFGSNRERQKDAIDQGLKTEVSEGAAALAAIPQAALDSILTVVGANFFLKPAGEAAGGLLTRARRGATAGVITEIPTEIGQAVLERAQAGLSLTSAEAMREYGEAGLAAGILGGGIGGVGGAVGPRGAPEAAPESGIPQLLLSPPSEAEFGRPVTRTEPLQLPAPPKQITGPDDLGLTVDSKGETKTRDQRTAARTEGMKVVERARAELQSTGEISSSTMQKLRTAPVPFKAVSDLLKNTRYEPALDLIEGTDLPAGLASRDVSPRPIQDKTRFDDAIAKATTKVDTVQAELEQVLEETAVDETTEAELKQKIAKITKGKSEADLTKAQREKINEEIRLAVEGPELTSPITATKGKSDVKSAEVKSETGRTSVSADKRNVGEKPERTVSSPADTTKGAEGTAAFRRDSLGRTGVEPRPTDGTTAAEQAALDKFLEASANEFNIIRQALDPDPAFAADTVKAAVVEAEGKDYDIAMPPATDDEVAAVRKGVYDKTQVLLKDQPDEMTVYRIGKMPKGQVKSFTLNPKFGETFSTQLPWVEGKGDLKAYKVKKSDVLGSPDITTRGAIGEDELIINVDSVTPTTLKTTDRAKASLGRDATPGKRTGKMPAQPIPAELKEAKAKREAAEVKAQPREDLKFADQRSDKATKDRAEKVKTKEADTRQAAIFAAQDTDIQEQGNVESDLSAPQAPMTAADKDKILKLMNAKRTKAKPLVAAIQKYFNQFPTFTAALDAVIYDAGTRFPDRSKNDPEYAGNTAKGKFYLANPKAALPSMGRTSANKIVAWMESENTNMSVELRKHVIDSVQAESKARVSRANYIAGDRVADARRDTEAAEEAEAGFIQDPNFIIKDSITGEELSFNTKQERETYLRSRNKAEREFNLPAELVIDTPLRPSVKAAILKNDLAGALDALRFTTPSKDIALLAKRLMDNIGNTKLITKKNLKTDDGFTKLAGYFDPETNTIALDEKAGINAHALLHEMLHAVTSATIANKSHSLTKKLNRIFEGVKEQLAGEYGLTNLDEFVAEAFANPDFQTQLKITTVNGSNPFIRMVRAITNYVRTLFKRPHVPETSTFDAVDKLVQEIIAPTYNGRAATKIYMALGTPAGAKKLLNNQASPNTFDTTTKEGESKYLQQGKALMKSVTVPVAAKNVWINLQPVNILGALAESRVPGAKQLNSIINRMSADLRRLNESTDVIVNDLRALRRKGLARFARGQSTEFQLLQSIVPTASYYRVDPRVATFEKAYGRKATYFDPVTNKTVSNPKYDPEVAEKVYKELRKDYLNMSKGGRDLYSIITNSFAKSLVDVDTAVAANLAATINDDAAVKRIQKRLSTFLALERGSITPFAPLQREGKHRLEYNAVDPQTGIPEVFVEYFKTKGQREKAVTAVGEYNKKELAKITDTTRRNKVAAQVNIPPVRGTKEGGRSYNSAPSDSFVGQVFAVLKAEGANDATVNGILDLVLDSMPERSLMQSLRVRKDIRGFKGDVTPSGTMADKRFFGLLDDSYDLIGAVQNKGRDYNRQVVQMTYGAEIQKFQRDVLGTADLKSETIDENTLMYKTALNKIAEFAKSPDIPKWSQSLNAAGYAWTMGWNFSSAGITQFDVAMSVAPRLMGKYGDAKALKIMGTATGVLARSPKFKTVQSMQADGTMGPRVVKTGRAGFSIGNYDYEALRAMSKQDIADAKLTPEAHARLLDLEIMSERALENAQINQSLNQEELDMNNAKDALEKINSWTSYLFHHAERYNREVTMTATYLLELDRLRTNPKNADEKALTDTGRKELAAETAIVETEFTLGATASAGRPVYAQKGVGNVLMLFKRFAIAKYHMMATMTNDAFPRTGEGPEAKANRRIAQHQLARFLFSTGLFAGIAGMPLMGAVGQIYDFFVDDDEDDFDAMLRKTVGEGFYKGIVNEALGADVASRIGLNSLLYRPPIIDKDQAGLITLIEQLGGPLIGIYMSMDRGYDLFKEGEVFKGTQAFFPAAARNALKAGEQFVTGEVATRRGDAVVEDIGIAQILLQFGGFANAELIQQYDYNKNERRKVSYIGKQRTKLLRKANIAASNRDREAYRQVMKEIKEYNRGLPRAAREKNIILPATISRSRKAFVTRTGKMIGGIEYTPLMLDSLKQYDQGLQLFD